ncbi:MAG: T9SS type A sorting domain-containing protein [Saprospiraceae bacterium]|nr:T9SS type A sorting domain-containing protein [Saprospiraceae bacterium]
MRICVVLILSLLSQAVISQNVWQNVEESQLALKSSQEREIIPSSYSTFSLDFKMMKKRLQKAKPENLNGKSKSISLDLPLPNGQVETFIFNESSCMSPVLSTKYPSIKSYRGISNSNKYNQARIDFGPMGFHGVIFSEAGTIYIDPYFANPDENYISYYTRDHIIEDDYPMSCGVNTHHILSEAEKTLDLQSENFYKSSGAASVVKRTYRLAIATTGEWGSIYNTKENVMARIVTGVNRINMIFENEISTNFVLIDRNDELIFIDGSTDPYENPTLGSSLLGQNSAAINNIVGSNAYDIGHVFTVRCSDVGGVANPGVVCTGLKANGVSCVGFSNISSFMVNTTAHEIGHQFSGGHSWNNCPGILSQKSDGTAFEPGSGSTILSYAGSCGNQNIKGTNDDYFHVGNLEQFLRFMETTGRCAEEEVTDNNPPELNVPVGDGLFIPISTPFELDGSATDIDGDALTYNWEQMDTGPTSNLGEPMGNAPLFRSYPPSSETSRVFPRLPFIINNLESRFEVLPNYDREITFRFTVKDNHPGGGITVWEEIQFESSTSAGPFRVTSPSEITFLEVGQRFDIEWDVANTDNDIINCQFVDIFLSLDDGETFDIVLASNTPNDGMESIVVPNQLTSTGKIKVKASNNIFFQLNRSNVVIRQPSSPGFYIDVSSNEFDICLPDVVEIELTGTSFQGFDEAVALEITSPLPEGASVSFSDNNISSTGTATLSVDLSDVEDSQSFVLELLATAENAEDVIQELNFNVTGTSFDDLELIAPENGFQGVDQTPIFEWSPTQNADSYTLEISKSPRFESSNVITEAFLPDTSFLPNIIFDNSSLYYWRVVSNNKCISTPGEINTFSTVNLDCKLYAADNIPTNISFSGTVEIDGIAKVFDVGVVADVNVKNISGQHSDAFQLTGTLISPSGTEAVMFDQTCFGSTDFNIGFDDQSPLDFQCPLAAGEVVKPQISELSVFNNEKIDGEWIFRINDNKSGDGGQFTSFDLEICASFEIENPFIVNNNILDIKPGFSEVINNDKLLVDDNDNFAEDLIYTLVVTPSFGTLSLDGTPLSVGDQFTQEALNNRFVVYNHEGTEEGEDKFIFTVIDGDGGWIDLTTFDINVDENAVSATTDLLESSTFKIYPNPTNDLLYIKDMSFKNENWQVQIYGIDGQLLQEDNLYNEKRLSLATLSGGVFILKLSSESGTASYRISVVR